MTLLNILPSIKGRGASKPKHKPIKKKKPKSSSVVARSQKVEEEREMLTFSQLLSQGWLAKKITTMLDEKDVMRFAAVSRDCRVVHLQPPMEDIVRGLNVDGPYRTDYPSLWQTLPRISNAHTVVVKCRWMDQGWGNRKGMLSMVANGGRAPNEYKPWSEDVVAGAEPAPHEMEPMTLSFRPGDETDPRQPYSIWRRIGGGGGHRLRVRDLCVRVIAYRQP
jgi:hypothetical protein